MGAAGTLFLIITARLGFRCRSAGATPHSSTTAAARARPSAPLAALYPARLCNPSYSSCVASTTPDYEATGTIERGGGPAPQEQQHDDDEERGGGEEPRDAADVFRRWGCSEAEVSQIVRRYPSIRRMGLPLLQSKLETLRGVGLHGPDLVRIITCRPRFLSASIGDDLPARLAFLRTLFASDDDDGHGLLLRAIVRNPSLLNYDVDATMRPCVRLYESLGVSRRDLGRLLVSRPTIIPRSSLDPDKLDLIRGTRLTPRSPMYKYVVSVAAVSRTETLRRKLANLEKFGFSAEEVVGILGPWGPPSSPP